jgi:hypothetical protein
VVPGTNGEVAVYVRMPYRGRVRALTAGYRLLVPSG